MKPIIFFFISFQLLYSCSVSDPTACSCGKELMKSVTEQNQDLMEACAHKAEQMEEAKKIKWFEEVMDCMNSMP